MTISLTAVLLIIWAHWIGDFILQSDYHAQNKSKNSFILGEHVFLYSIPLACIGLFIPVSLVWVFFNAVAHFCTDWITSRITSKLWAKKQVHWFFVTIGADQAIHFTTLFVSYVFLLPYMR